MELTHDLWPMDALGPGYTQMKHTVDEHLRRANVRASKMSRAAVKKTLQHNPGARNLILLFQGVDDELVNLALTLEHLEHTVDYLEQRKVEGQVVSIMIQKLQVLHACALSN